MEGVILNGKVVPLDEFFVKPTCTFAEFGEDVLSPEKIKAAIKILKRNSSNSGMSPWYTTFHDIEGGEKMYLFRVCIVNVVTEEFDVINVVTKNEMTARIKGFNSSQIQGSIDDMEIEVEELVSWNKK